MSKSPVATLGKVAIPISPAKLQFAAIWEMGGCNTRCFQLLQMLVP